MTIRDFKTNAMKPNKIVTTGRVLYDTCDVNVSSIQTKLIQEAGRWCRLFASDLFIDWRPIQEMLDCEAPIESKSFLFGFHESGVDNAEQIIRQYGETSTEKFIAAYRYRSIWRLDITVENHKIALELYECVR